MAGEEWILDDSGCCPRYKAECTDFCPEIECPEFYEPVKKSLQSGQCCPDVECGKCRKDTLIFNLRYASLTCLRACMCLYYHIIYSTEPPTDACIYENIYIVDATGFQKSVAQPSATKKGGAPQLPEPEKKLYKVIHTD